MLVFDRTKNEFLFEGDFEDYRNEVLRDCFNELDTGTKCIELVSERLECVLNSKNFEEFFENLEKKDINIFAEYADCILIRRRKDYFLNGYGKRVNYYDYFSS